MGEEGECRDGGVSSSNMGKFSVEDVGDIGEGRRGSPGFDGKRTGDE